jgi:chitosanase
MISELQKKAAQAIVNIFETGRVRGNYGSVTLLAGDTGHLTYGRSQTTLASGNLYLLIKAYCGEEGAEFAAELRGYLDPLANRDTVLDHDMEFRACLSRAGNDPVMHYVQNQFFDRVYWEPSLRAANGMGIGTALGSAVVYDSHVHGSWKRIRDLTDSDHGSANSVGEESWISEYVSRRKNWLEHHDNPLLRRTIYRMDAFRQLIDGGNWDLSLPFRVRGVEIHEAALLEGTAVRVSAVQDEDAERILRLESRPVKGEDVREVQQALSKANFPVEVDGVFGSKTENAVKDFQKSRQLVPDGIVGPATRRSLGL